MAMGATASARRGFEVACLLAGLLVSGCGQGDGAGSSPVHESAGGSVGEAGTSAGSSSDAATNSVALTSEDGWVDAESDSFRVQGALYLDGDPASLAKTVGDFSGDHACMSGETFELPQPCEPEPPFADCFDMFRGSEIRLNFNQQPGGEPMPFDATGVAGFSFDLAGTTRQLRVIATAADGTEYCNSSLRSPREGHNTILLSDLIALCFKGRPTPTAEESRESLVSLAWHVVPVYTGVVPFDFCVSNLRVLLE